MDGIVPAVAKDAVLVQSGKLPVEPIEVKGYDFNNGLNYHELLKSFKTTGFQALHFGLAVEEITRMVCIKIMTLYIFMYISINCIINY